MDESPVADETQPTERLSSSGDNQKASNVNKTEELEMGEYNVKKSALNGYHKGPANLGIGDVDYNSNTKKRKVGEGGNNAIAVPTLSPLVDNGNNSKKSSSDSIKKSSSDSIKRSPDSIKKSSDSIKKSVSAGHESDGSTSCSSNCSCCSYSSYSSDSSSGGRRTRGKSKDKPIVTQPSSGRRSRSNSRSRSSSIRTSRDRRDSRDRRRSRSRGRRRSKDKERDTKKNSRSRSRSKSKSRSRSRGRGSKGSRRSRSPPRSKLRTSTSKLKRSRSRSADRDKADRDSRGNDKSRDSDSRDSRGNKRPNGTGRSIDSAKTHQPLPSSSSDKKQSAKMNGGEMNGKHSSSSSSSSSSKSPRITSIADHVVPSEKQSTKPPSKGASAEGTPVPAPALSPASTKSSSPSDQSSSSANSPYDAVNKGSAVSTPVSSQTKNPEQGNILYDKICGFADPSITPPKNDIVVAPTGNHAPNKPTPTKNNSLRVSSCIRMNKPADVRGIRTFKAVLCGDGWKRNDGDRVPSLNWEYCEGATPPTDPRPGRNYICVRFE